MNIEPVANHSINQHELGGYTYFTVEPTVESSVDEFEELFFDETQNDYRYEQEVY